MACFLHYQYYILSICIFLHKHGRKSRYKSDFLAAFLIPCFCLTGYFLNNQIPIPTASDLTGYIEKIMPCTPKDFSATGYVSCFFAYIPNIFPVAGYASSFSACIPNTFSMIGYSYSIALYIPSMFVWIHDRIFSMIKTNLRRGYCTSPFIIVSIFSNRILHIVICKPELFNFFHSKISGKLMNNGGNFTSM